MSETTGARVGSSVTRDVELVVRVVDLALQHFVEDGRLDEEDLNGVVELTELAEELVPEVRAALRSAGVEVCERRATAAIAGGPQTRTRSDGGVSSPESLESADAFVRSLERGPDRLLSALEEARLGRIVQACGAGERAFHGFALVDLERSRTLGIRARTVFEQRNVRLVYWIVRQYAGQGMEVEDLIQEGWFGLRRAVEKFDPERGLRFSTYATWWVRQAVTRALADKSRTIRLPVHVVESLQKVMRVRERMLMETGHVNVRDLAERTGYSVGKVKTLIRLGRGPVSLDSPIGDGLNVLSDVLPSQSDFEEGAEDRELRRLVDRALSSLPDREREVVVRRFGIGGADTETLEEIGRTWGVTRERVRQVEAKALRRLRARARSDGLGQFTTT